MGGVQEQEQEQEQEQGVWMRLPSEDCVVKQGGWSYGLRHFHKLQKCGKPSYVVSRVPSGTHI